MTALVCPWSEYKYFRTICKCLYAFTYAANRQHRRADRLGRNPFSALLCSPGSSCNTSRSITVSGGSTPRSPGSIRRSAGERHGACEDPRKNRWSPVGPSPSPTLTSQYQTYADATGCQAPYEWEPTQTPIRPIDRYRCVACTTPNLDAPKRNDPTTMLARSSIRGNAAAVKSRCLSQDKKRYVTRGRSLAQRKCEGDFSQSRSGAPRG